MKDEERGEVLEVGKPSGANRLRGASLGGAVPVTAWTKCKGRVRLPSKRGVLCATRGKRQRDLGSPERSEER
jgi:hypothetical protein